MRALRKDPAYAFVAAVLLALGIGANAAVFSVANAVLFRPLPYSHPERLVVTLHNGDAPVSPGDFLAYQKNVGAFEAMSAAQMWTGSLTSSETAEQIPGIRMTANMTHLLGVDPLLGRPFLPEDEQAGKSQSLLLSYGLWKRRFGGDPGIVGRQIVLDRLPYTVVGVMPANFRFAPFWATRAQMWSPLVLEGKENDHGGRSLRVFARLKPGATVKSAQAEMDAVAGRLATLFPQTNAKLGISVVPLREKVVKNVRPTILVLLATVTFVLLIACATAGNLMLARAVARSREMALRLALGAQRKDLLRLALSESFLLAVLGGAGGALFANWAVNILLATLPPGSIPRQNELGFDRVALLFTAGLSLLTALATGLIPALQARKTDPMTDLKQANRGGVDSPSGNVRTRGALVTAEVALSFILLAGAGLMARTMLSLQSVDGGFDPRHVLTMQVSLAGTDFNRGDRRANAFHEIRSRLASMSGIESASAINHLPIGGDMWRLRYTIEGRALPRPGEELSAVYRVTMPEYFTAMRIGKLQGRDFNWHDNAQSSAVAIVNETLARRRWPGESALGKVIHFGASPQHFNKARVIVGVVKDARQNSWTDAPEDEIYLPYDQCSDAFGLSYLTFVLRVRGRPVNARDEALRTVASFDRNITVAEVASMEQVIADELWRQRLASILMESFAGIAVLLAGVGIYGVISHSVRRRTQEIGIRMALGAGSRNLVGLVLLEGMKPVALGALAGVSAALWLARFMQTLLYGVSPADPLTFVSIASTLLIVCLIANAVPALRATRIDPLTALRHD